MPNLAIGIISLNKKVKKLKEVVTEVKSIALPILSTLSLKKINLLLNFFDLMYNASHQKYRR